MTIAIIGTGSIGSALAQDLVGSGETILLAGRDDDKTRTAAAAINASIEATSVADAIARADIVVPAIWLDALKALLSDHADALAGRIIVDPSNPIEDDGQGGFRKTLPADQSSGQLVGTLLPLGARLVKAFGTLSAGSLRSAAHQSPLVVGFYATDDTIAGDDVADLIGAAGFDPVFVGGMDQSARIEVFGDLHEFGGLGQPATRETAVRALHTVARS